MFGVSCALWFLFVKLSFFFSLGQGPLSWSARLRNELWVVDEEEAVLPRLHVDLRHLLEVELVSPLEEPVGRSARGAVLVVRSLCISNVAKVFPSVAKVLPSVANVLPSGANVLPSGAQLLL